MKRNNKQQKPIRKRQKRIEKRMKARKTRRQNVFWRIVLVVMISIYIIPFVRALNMEKNGQYHFEYGIAEREERKSHHYVIEYTSLPDGIIKASGRPAIPVIKGDTVVVKVYDKWPFWTRIIEVKQRHFN